MKTIKIKNMEETKTKQLTITPKFELGQIVFLITDPSQSERMVIGYLVREHSIRYYLGLGDIESCHSEMEIAINKDWNKI